MESFITCNEIFMFKKMTNEGNPFVVGGKIGGNYEGIGECCF